MPQVMTKKAINDLLVAERKSMRDRQKHSDFMKRTLSIFNGQKSRCVELNEADKGSRIVEYTLEEFRELVRQALERGTCEYCGAKITVKKFTADHRLPVKIGGPFTKENTAIVCCPCNWQKGGEMTDHEFQLFNKLITQNFVPAIVTDLRQRLSTGGKWVGKG